MQTEIALVADQHGNWPATQAVDRDLSDRGIGRIFCLGDMVGKGPSSARTLDWARARCERVLCGNWDEAAVVNTEFQSAVYCRAKLGEERLEYIRSLPFEHHLMLSGRRIRLVHGRPVIGLVHPDSDREVLKALFHTGEGSFDMVGFADCHQAFSLTVGQGTLFNTGSVGNSIGIAQRACYLILRGTEGPEDAPLDITHVTLPYDVEQAVRDAEAERDLPYAGAYINEIRTGVYSR